MRCILSVIVKFKMLSLSTILENVLSVLHSYFPSPLPPVTFKTKLSEHVADITSIVRSNESKTFTSISFVTEQSPSDAVTVYLVETPVTTIGFRGSLKSRPVKGTHVYVKFGLELLNKLTGSNGHTSIAEATKSISAKLLTIIFSAFALEQLPS